MTRTRKIVIASTVVLVGVLLSWPFRRSGNYAVDIPEPVEILRNVDGDPITATSQPMADSHVAVAPAAVAARPASTAMGTPELEAEGQQGFDLENHPALTGIKDDARQNSQADAGSIPDAQMSPSAESDAHARPAYATVNQSAGGPADEPWPEEVIHIVHNGDTLERLADRYLDDPQRAVDIFELNRDQLSNPHLLPIGVELRIPATNSSPVD